MMMTSRTARSALTDRTTAEEPVATGDHHPGPLSSTDGPTFGPTSPHSVSPLVQSPAARWTTRIIGIAAVIAVGFTVWLGLWVTPSAEIMGNLYRLVYIHPATAFVALYLAFGLATVASLLYLWPRTRSLFWDRLAATSVEVGMVFIFLTCVSGSIWGRPTWGVWWAWDPLLTATAILFILYLGYIALRRVPAEPEVRAKRSAIAAIISALDIPIIHFSVYWWNTLHQGPTILNAGLSPRIYGSMAWTMLLSFVALALVFVWLLLMRYRIGVLQDYLGDGEMTVALHERMAEGVVPDAGPAARSMGSAQPAPVAQPTSPEPVGVGGRSSGSVTA